MKCRYGGNAPSVLNSTRAHEPHFTLATEGIMYTDVSYSPLLAIFAIWCVSSANVSLLVLAPFYGFVRLQGSGLMYESSGCLAQHVEDCYQLSHPFYRVRGSFALLISMLYQLQAVRNASS
jgi:hypothetical protein